MPECGRAIEWRNFTIRRGRQFKFEFQSSLSSLLLCLFQLKTEKLRDMQIAHDRYDGGNFRQHILLFEKLMLNSFKPQFNFAFTLLFWINIGSISSFGRDIAIR
jgi:hypothetical protein